MPTKIKCNNAVRKSRLSWIDEFWVCIWREVESRYFECQTGVSSRVSRLVCIIEVQQVKWGWDTIHHAGHCYQRNSQASGLPSRWSWLCSTAERHWGSHTHARWVMGSQTQQTVTQPKGCSLTLIVCRKESALVFFTPVVSGERKPTAASLGLLADISSSCRHSSRRGLRPAASHSTFIKRPYFIYLFIFCPVTFFLPCHQSVSHRVISYVSQSDKLWFAAVHVECACWRDTPNENKCRLCF